MMSSALAACAAPFARIALANIQCEYPNKLDHVLNSAADLRSPQQLHPVFYGSFDWHSSVHMHWLLVRLLRLFPEMADGERIHEVLDFHFMPARVAQEIAYLQRPFSKSFERTYGWAWLLKLQAELNEAALTIPRAAIWRDALQPLANGFAQRYLEFLPLARFPIRAGTHANSAFGLLFALDYAEGCGDVAVRELIHQKSVSWFGEDRRYPASYEPGGDDFLSGGLVEAALMLRVLATAAYAGWWAEFCPAPPDLQTWLTPVAVSDRGDPKLVHLDGLNLSRAWCWKLLLPHLPRDLLAPVNMAIDAHIAASLPEATGGVYAGTHWLASFALLALC